MPRPRGGHVFQPTGIIFELVEDIIGMNLLTEVHEDRSINVASREKCPDPGGHIFKATKTIFEIIQNIIGTNLLTKFHDDRKINVTSRVLTRKICPAPWWPYMIGMNLRTEFHEDWTINVASRENATPLGSHVFQANVNIFELIKDNNKTNLLTTFNDKRAKMALGRSPERNIVQTNNLVNSNKTNVLSKFHENWAKNVTSTVGGHVISPIPTIFELVRDINVLTNFHDWANIVTSRVFTRKTAPPTGGHVFQRIGTTFELNQDIIKTII
ncbi:hypothetical protein DPMN_125427 [Dreissena polymorpha]|uniref:Uncharacterized protein n=1 Tax=Dreissena polymorpha TaxID=45954 RepID=A0A9D4GVE1_DREPO|nr:hypothetical protein DPMN_125427 [Dreissena polymorpha]